ncbi:hypothetical protein BDZ94DRAFT_1313173 [Collybia nuda]|uniref:Uncharacterized protein n=1 Tax=Collybia nuda TaxID=64659 RepID=A0A9P5XVM0_9AGAR|nr:hypothetical protein BDZ94DRAFT_1313173 [Collybia nuda]
MSKDTKHGKVPKRCSLKNYLENTWLPAFKRPGISRPLNQIQRAHPWPKYPDLQRDIGTRRLVEVLRIDQWSFMLLAEDYMKHVSSTYIVNESLVEEEHSPRLRLPSRDMVTYEKSDLEFLSQIRNEDDFVTLVQDYILGTISEAIRLVEGFSLSHFLTDELKFLPSSHLCPAHHARWDILALPESDRFLVPFAVIFVPPWEFGTQDFADFTSAQRFEHNALDTLDTSTNTTSDKLWAVVHDTCQGRGKHFAVTNYTRWAFGEFSSNGTIARVTDSFEAPILNLDGTHDAVPWLGFNVVELLTFWIHTSLQQRPSRS